MADVNHLQAFHMHSLRHILGKLGSAGVYHVKNVEVKVHTRFEDIEPQHKTRKTCFLQTYVLHAAGPGVPIYEAF